MNRRSVSTVRRRPGSRATRFSRSQSLHEEHLTELEELQDLGYHDSTAPHPSTPRARASDHEAHLDSDEPHPAQLEPEAEELEQPKRRFLRRNRPAALSQPAAPDTGFHEEPPTIEHHDLPRTRTSSLTPTNPNLSFRRAGLAAPTLQFENPPKRPRFTAGAAGTRDGRASGTLSRRRTARHARDRTERTGTPGPRVEHFDEHAADGPGAQETTEFDVPKHLTEAPHEEDEDVLEETPEFLQDTPEHDRLWFEQRPPKDFDFNG